MLETLAPNIRRLIAPNPSPMTFWGTNTYIIGDRELAVIDPGPLGATHLDAILGSLESGQVITKILVTHSHLDHSPLATELSNQTGASVYAFGDSFAGRSPLMTSLAATADLGGGEGIDGMFQPDHTLSDGENISHENTLITAIWTPGHLSNHLCFSYENTLFCGDHVMGWATSLVSPPDGDLGAFMRSCEKLLTRDETLYYPGHGDPIENGPARVRWLLNHRKSRETQILTQLGKGAQDAKGLAHAIYDDVNPALLGAAARNVLAHLLDLYERKLIDTDGAISAAKKFYLI